MEISESVDWELNARIVQRPAGCRIPLTAFQSRIWRGWLDRKDRPAVMRVCASSSLISGKLNPTLLQACIEFVLGRHEALRTRIAFSDGTLVQHVDPPAAYQLQLTDLTCLSPSLAQEEARRMVQCFLDQELNPLTDPLFESRLWKLSDERFVFVIAMEHSFADGISYGILNREIWELYYQGVRERLPLSMEPLLAQFGDYAVWQQRTCSAWRRAHESYWRQHLEGVRCLKMPPDAEFDERAVPVVATIPFGGSLTKTIRTAARHLGTLPSMMILAIYTIVLARWCARADLLITYVAHGRYRRPELQNMVGFIANLLHLRVILARRDTFRELVMQVQLELSRAMEHLDYDRVPDFISDCSSEAFFNWQSTTSTRREVDHHFISECMLVPAWAQALKGGPADQKLVILPFHARWSGFTKFSPIFYDTPEDIYLAVTYTAQVLSPVTIARFGAALKEVAAQVSENPLTRIENISINL